MGNRHRRRARCHHVKSYTRIRFGRLEHVSDYWRCCGQMDFGF